MATEIGINEKFWLIKSATRIMGPFTAEEILSLLKAKNVAIIDEVRNPSGRWLFIREHPYFAEKLKTLVYDVDHSEHTMTESVTHQTAITRTDVIPTRTDITPLPHFDEQTPPPVPRRESTLSGIKDITPSIERTTSTGPSAAARSYGSVHDQRVQQKVQRTSSIWLVVLFICVVAAGGYGYLKLTPRGPKQLGYDALIAQALKYRSLGIYGRSLDAYKRAELIREPARDIKEMMAPLLISEDRQTTEGRRVLESSLTGQTRNRSELVDTYLSIAVSYSLEGNLHAAEDVLQKASGHDPYRPAILMNLAILEFKRGKYAEAYRGFETVWQRNRELNLALLGKAMSAVELGKAGRTEYLANVAKEIALRVPQTNYLKPELLLFKAYTESLLGEVNSLQKTVGQYLSAVHNHGRNYTQPYDMDWRFVQYESSLLRYCQELAGRTSMDAETKSLLATCYMESSQDGEASKLLKEALVAAPKNPLVILSQATFNIKIGRFPEALVLLKLPEVQAMQLKSLLQGQICLLRNDVECARSAFLSVHTKQETDIYAIHGLAWSMFASKNRSSAFDYTRSGLHIEPNYIPLLELRDSMESQ